jgi:hypothetical protein
VVGGRPIPCPAESFVDFSCVIVVGLLPKRGNLRSPKRGNRPAIVSAHLLCSLLQDFEGSPGQEDGMRSLFVSFWHFDHEVVCLLSSPRPPNVEIVDRPFGPCLKACREQGLEWLHTHAPNVRRLDVDFDFEEKGSSLCRSVADSLCHLVSRWLQHATARSVLVSR